MISVLRAASDKALLRQIVRWKKIGFRAAHRRMVQGTLIVILIVISSGK